MDPLPLSLIATFANGELERGDPNRVVVSISTDSRTVRADELFLPLRGDNFDGHNFIAQTVQRGAAGAIVDKSWRGDVSSEFVLIRVADARWVSVLVLLTLQSSFLLPPFGYALMMVRGVLREPVPFGAFVRALAPFLAAQWFLLLLILLFPQLTHIGQSSESSTRLPSASMSNEEFNRRLNEMIKIPEPEDLNPR